MEYENFYLLGEISRPFNATLGEVRKLQREMHRYPKFDFCTDGRFFRDSVGDFWPDLVKKIDVLASTPGLDENHICLEFTSLEFTFVVAFVRKLGSSKLKRSFDTSDPMYMATKAWTRAMHLTAPILTKEEVSDIRRFVNDHLDQIERKLKAND